MTTFVNLPSLIQEQESDEDAAATAATLFSAASDEVDLTSFGHLPSPPLLLSSSHLHTTRDERPLRRRQGCPRRRRVVSIPPLHLASLM